MSEVEKMTTDQLMNLMADFRANFDSLTAPYTLASAKRFGVVLAKIYPWPAEDDCTDVDILLAWMLRRMVVEGVPEYPDSSISHLMSESDNADPHTSESTRE